jgi:hypothetical protein
MSRRNESNAEFHIYCKTNSDNREKIEGAWQSIINTVTTLRAAEAEEADDEKVDTDDDDQSIATIDLGQVRQRWRAMGVDGLVFLKATRKIQPNDQILVDYGKLYWSYDDQGDDDDADAQDEEDEGDSEDEEPEDDPIADPDYREGSDEQSKKRARSGDDQQDDVKGGGPPLKRQKSTVESQTEAAQ